MNIVVIRACSNSCPYCFEADERDRAGKDRLKLEDARTLAAWSANAGVGSVGFLGGEPFLHPELREIVGLFRASIPRAPRTIFTGGVVDRAVLESFTPADAGLLVNVNEPRDYPTPDRFRQVVDLVDEAIRRGFDVMLGFNAWRTDVDAAFMPRLAHALGRPGFRWAVANPMWGFPPRTVRPEAFPALASACFAMLREATDRGLQATLDCHLPLCFFADSQLAWIVRHQPDVAARLGRCQPSIDVTPELEAIRCFAVSGFLRLRVLDHPTEAALRDEFRRRIDLVFLEHDGLHPECAGCPDFRARRCQAGCLGWRRTPVGAEPPDLPQRMYELLKSGEAAQTQALLESTARWFHTPLSLYLAALAAVAQGDSSAAYRYAARAQAHADEEHLKRAAGSLLAGLARPSESDGSRAGTEA